MYDSSRHRGRTRARRDRRECWCSGRSTGVGVEESLEKRGHTARAQATAHRWEGATAASRGCSGELRDVAADECV